MVIQRFKIWLTVIGLPVGGIVVGMVILFDQLRNLVATIFDINDEQKQAEDDHHDDELHIEVTESAAENLGLVVRRVSTGNYEPSYEIPASIKALPGAESLRISSRFAGLVRRVFVSEGASVRTGDPLVEIELTGESLSEAQSDFLLAIQKEKNLSEELNRLAPLVQAGGLANKRSLELRYEQKQLVAEIETHRQELILRGLSPDDVARIEKDGKLIKRTTIRVPENLVPPQLNLVLNESKDEEPSFIVEQVLARVGSMVTIGGQLADLSYHEMLTVEGHAFERDLDLIKDLMNSGKPVSLSVGVFSDTERVKDCRVAYVGNHADRSSNTYPFFVYLVNEIERQSGDATSLFISWKWKPGQLGHIELPKTRYENKLIVPRDAVVENGISTLVFKWQGPVEHDHGPEEEDEADHEHEHADLFVPVEVKLLHLDNDVAVIDTGGKLQDGTRIAFNCAAQLLFTMQSGSGGHSHDHPH